MQKLTILCLLVLSLGLTGCTDYENAMSGEQVMSIKLPKGQKLVGVSWSSGKMWYGYRQMREGESPEVVTYSSPIGNGGGFTFTESR